LPVVCFPQTALADIGRRNDARFSQIWVTTLKIFNHIIIAIDGSAPADRALETGLALAMALNAAVKLVTVSEKWSILEIAAQVPMHVGEQVEHYEVLSARISLKILSTAQDKAARHNVTMQALRVGNRPVAEGIVSTATKNCDLIVMACSSHRTSYGHGSPLGSD
jgi:nucleotide-binding universal stress UspA family protein